MYEKTITEQAKEGCDLLGISHSSAGSTAVERFYFVQGLKSMGLIK